MDTALTEYQQSFVEAFLSPTASPWQRLSAAPGLGKTTTALDIIERVYRSDLTSKILFIGPATLCMQVADILENRVSTSDPFYFSRRRIRELAAASNAPGWPTRIVALADHVARQPEVSERLRSIDWDLIVVDEADRSARLVQTLIPTLRPARVLLLASSDLDPGEMPVFAQIQTTHWVAEQLRAAYKPKVRAVEFHRSVAERNVIQRVADLISELNTTEEARAFWRTIQQASMSSFNALEQLLTRQLAELKDPNVAGSRSSGMPEDFATRDVDLPSISLWKNGVGVAEKLLSVLDAIGKTPADGKLTALMRLIDDLGNHHLRYGLWIVTSFRATAWYLSTSLSERVSGVHVLTADMSYSRAVELSDSRSHERSILVSTVASTKGLQFPWVTDVVLYDRPSTENLLYIITSRLPVDPAPELLVFLEDEGTAAQFKHGGQEFSGPSRDAGPA